MYLRCSGAGHIPLDFGSLGNPVLRPSEGICATIDSMSASATFQFPTGPVTLTGDAVVLRRSSAEDVGLLIEASNDAEIIRWTRMPMNLDDPAAAALLAGWRERVAEGYVRQYVIAQDMTADPVGLTSLILQDANDPWCADVVYWLLPRGRHRGLATAAVQTLLRWAFDQTGLRRAALYTLVGNGASERVAQRCRFRFDRLVDDPRGGAVLRLNRWVYQPCPRP